MKKFIILLAIFCCGIIQAVSAAQVEVLFLDQKTRDLQKSFGEAQDACAAEIATTGNQNGTACQKRLKARDDYMSYYKEQECKINAKLANFSMCKKSKEELLKINDQVLQKKVDEYKQKNLQNQPVDKDNPKVSATSNTENESKQATVSSPNNSASTPNDVEVPGMVTTSTANKSTGSSRSVSTPVSSSSSSSSSGALFGDLANKGLEIFGGMREIIYAVAGFGIMAVAIGGFFGVINWRWLASIIIGLMVIASASSLINYMVDAEVISDRMITDSLINAS